MRSSWFDVDKEGLARILKRRGLEFVLYELLANAWDSEATEVTVTLVPVEGKRQARLTVEDNDPKGFVAVSHAYTMFADSLRRGDPEARGRFNLGEKLVLAVAQEATIVTKTAAFRFDESGRHRMTQRTPFGSKVELVFPATREDITGILEAARNLIPPIPTTLNGDPLEIPTPVTQFTASLDTVLPDVEGNLKPCQRKTIVTVYQDGSGWLYELGVPVVETGDTFSYDVGQKTPLNMDRDNVPPSYLRKLRVLALNELHTRLNSEDCNSTWVRDALRDKNVSQDAVRSAVRARFGDKVASYDPNDPQANMEAVAQGYVLVHGKELSAPEWENVRIAGAIRPAGQVFPSPKAFEEQGAPLRKMKPEEWSSGMAQIVQYAKRLFAAWFGRDIEVIIANDRHWDKGGAYGPGEPLYINKARQPSDFFDKGITDDVVEFLIHEGGHENEGNHLSEEYHRELCRLGAKMRDLKHLEPAKPTVAATGRG
jgi:hypothetical protein